MSKIQGIGEFTMKFKLIMFVGIVANGVLSFILIGPFFEHPLACSVFLLASNVLWQTICSFWQSYMLESKNYEARFRS